MQCEYTFWTERYVVRRLSTSVNTENHHQSHSHDCYTITWSEVTGIQFWPRHRRNWKLTSISCHWRTRTMCCITANVLQTKVDAQCDKLATDRFQVMASYLLKVVNFNLPHLHLMPPLAVTPSEFCPDLRHQKTSSWANIHRDAVLCGFVSDSRSLL